MTNEERLAWIEEKTKELQLGAAEIQVELAKLRVEDANRAGWAWEPSLGDEYWFLAGEGTPVKTKWQGDRLDLERQSFNNCFPTKEAAERHALRLRSMRPTCPVPKVGERYWVAMVDGNGQLAETWRWHGKAADIFLYNTGRAFATEEAAEAWIAEFGEAWTTLEDEA
jgi:hypothetical protein